MHRHALALLSAAAALAVAGSGCGRARAAWDSFVLEEHDKIIAEAPGCHAECTVMGATGRRQCAVRDYDCRAICTTIPECRPGGRPIQVCAVVQSRP